MAENSVKRKLTAILCADVKGYSRLMGEDEVGTFHTLSDYLEIINTIIKTHRGRVFSSPGDAIIAQFVSVVDAVECAVEIQQKIETKNADVPEDRKMQFRIGVNLGDVIEKEKQIYGDGVNIAARIETLAEPGGVSISRTVYNHAHKKIKFGYEYQGEHQVKNITEPVRVYKVLTAPEHAGQLIGEPKSPKRLSKQSYISIFVVLALVIAVAIWQFYPRTSEIEPASVEKMAYPLPDKPSIAVLPFKNISGDPEDDYIADGISENIISALSYIPELFIIDRNSSFIYKGKHIKVQQVSEELGVQYVLEGSTLKSGNKIRITAQLIDSLTGEHIWSERYDRDLNDLLNVLDEITFAIAATLQVALIREVYTRIHSTNNLDAWLYETKGRGIFLKFSKEAMIKSRELFLKALEKDPEFAGVVTFLAWTHFIDYRHGYTDSRQESFNLSVELANKSLEMDDSEPFTHELLAFIYLSKKQYEKAIEEGKKSIVLCPSRATGYLFFCEILYRQGYFEEAVRMCEKAIRLQPHTPLFYFGHMMNAYYWVERYEESLSIAKILIDKGRKSDNKTMEGWGYWGSIRAKIKLGRESEARKDVARTLEITPGHSLEAERRSTLYKPEMFEQEYEVMRKAGYPEHSSLHVSDNMSDDPEQEYFSDEITKDIK